MPHRLDGTFVKVQNCWCVEMCKPTKPTVFEFTKKLIICANSQLHQLQLVHWATTSHPGCCFFWVLGVRCCHLFHFFLKFWANAQIENQSSLSARSAALAEPRLVTIHLFWSLRQGGGASNPALRSLPRNG